MRPAKCSPSAEPHCKSNTSSNAKAGGSSRNSGDPPAFQTAYRPRYICLLPAPAAEKPPRLPRRCGRSLRQSRRDGRRCPGRSLRRDCPGTLRHSRRSLRRTCLPGCRRSRPRRMFRRRAAGAVALAVLEDGVAWAAGAVPRRWGSTAPWAVPYRAADTAGGSGSTAFRPGSPTAPAAPLAAPQRRSPGTQRPAPHSRGSPYSSTRCRWNRSPGRQGIYPSRIVTP